MALDSDKFSRQCAGAAKQRLLVCATQKRPRNASVANSAYAEGEVRSRSIQSSDERPYDS